MVRNQICVRVKSKPVQEPKQSGCQTTTKETAVVVPKSSSSANPLRPSSSRAAAVHFFLLFFFCSSSSASVKVLSICVGFQRPFSPKERRTNISLDQREKRSSLSCLLEEKESRRRERERGRLVREILRGTWSRITTMCVSNTSSLRD